jgi:hypothetical protein
MTVGGCVQRLVSGASFRFSSNPSPRENTGQSWQGAQQPATVAAPAGDGQASTGLQQELSPPAGAAERGASVAIRRPPDAMTGHWQTLPAKSTQSTRMPEIH